jgi:eukaryotic-like serine/threonine-protein kinase
MKRRALKLLPVTNGRPRLDRYELIAELAAGGMATVFLARIGGAGGFERFVAIKRLHPHLAHEHDFVDMFLDEARLAAGIHHPNVVPILEVGESSAGFYQVMEYIEGDTLANLDRAAQEGELLPLPVLLRISVDALLGLHAAHERKDARGVLVDLVHRDVSPQNILVGVDGTSRITDFGVARATTRLSSTRSGDLKGKLAYMAPEQVLGEPDLDRRADVFAMAIVVWEMLARKHLFRGPNDAATMNRVLRERVPDVREIDPTVPAAVAEIVARSLLRDKAQRHASAAEFAEALRGAGVPLATTPEVASYVQRLLGDPIAERREAVQAWLAATMDDEASGARRDSRIPGPPERVFESPTLEMERPALLAALAAGGVSAGADTAGPSVVTSGGLSSGARQRPDGGSPVPLILAGAVVSFVALFGLVRAFSHDSGGPTTTASSAVSLTSVVAPASAASAPADAAPAPATTPSALPPSASADAPSDDRTDASTKQGGTGGGATPVRHLTKPPIPRATSDLAASPY